MIKSFAILGRSFLITKKRVLKTCKKYKWHSVGAIKIPDYFFRSLIMSLCIYLLLFGDIVCNAYLFRISFMISLFQLIVETTQRSDI